MSAPPYPHLYRGKVRDLYDAGDGRLLIIASDRLSAFDVVMSEPVPDKGRILTALSAFWFELLADMAPNHVIAYDTPGLPSEWIGRTMLVHRCEMLPVECIVRGYLSGSGWKDYRATGCVSGVRLPAGLQPADQLPAPVFTPSTKAVGGAHDENIPFEAMVRLVGADRAAAARDMSIAVYERAAAHAQARGILLADTKFELGLLDGQLVLADEVLTPDSSRYWPAADWVPGTVPPSYDKQQVRDELEASGWSKSPPPPPLSPATVAATRARYVTAYERLAGRSFASWPGGADLSSTS
jgi:phosphoribosylaminoimidazole-succinocarboxamide synthase